MSQPPPSLVLPRANRFRYGIDRQVVVVARAAGIDLEPGAVGADAHVAAAAHLDFLAVGADRLDEAVVADGDVEPAVDAHLDAVDRVVGAAKVEAEAEPAHERARLLGDAVAVGVAVRGEVRRMRDVQRVAVEHRAARAVHRREHGVVVGLAVVVAVDEPQDAAHAGIGLQRAVAIDADEELAGEGRRDARRVVDDRRRGEHLDLEARRRLDAGENLVDGRGADRQRPARRHGRHVRRARRLLLRSAAVAAGRHQAKRDLQRDFPSVFIRCVIIVRHPMRLP